MEYVKVKNPKGPGYLLVAAHDTALLARFERWTEPPEADAGRPAAAADFPLAAAAAEPEPAAPSTGNQIAAYDQPVRRVAGRASAGKRGA